MPKSVIRAVLRRMQFTLHAARRTPHGASRLVHAISAWLVKTRRAPSRHSRDARVYGHTTTAMHKLSTPPPPSPARHPFSHPSGYTQRVLVVSVQQSFAGSTPPRQMVRELRASDHLHGPLSWFGGERLYRGGGKNRHPNTTGGVEGVRYAPAPTPLSCFWVPRELSLHRG